LSTSKLLWNHQSTSLNKPTSLSDVRTESGPGIDKAKRERRRSNRIVEAEITGMMGARSRSLTGRLSIQMSLPRNRTKGERLPGLENEHQSSLARRK
jgi:hypothetical protein